MSADVLYFVLAMSGFNGKECPIRRFSQSMKAFFELFRCFDARRIFGFIRRLWACHVQKSSVTICVLPAPFRWKATSRDFAKSNRVSDFSIHALRVEGDNLCRFCRFRGNHFLSMNFRVEGRPNLFILISPFVYFLSTPSGWRATSGTLGRHRKQVGEFSIHALRVEATRLQ